MPGKYPTAVQELKGAYKKDPQRKPKNEPQPTGGLGNPPIFFSPTQARCWHELEEMTPPGVAFNSDRFVYEQMAVLLDKSRSEGLNGAELGIFMRMMSSCGMTPVDRSRVTAVEKKKENPFSQVG